MELAEALWLSVEAMQQSRILMEDGTLLMELKARGIRSDYRTGAELTYDDRLLALVTCEYTIKDGRLMVVARKL